MKLYFQKPSPISSTQIKYEVESGNLYTNNELSVEKPYYQTFGDIYMNFDEQSGRLFSIDGRVVLDKIPVKNLAWQNVESAYLISSSLVFENLVEDVEYSYDPNENILLISNPLSSDEDIEYNLVLDNVIVGLSTTGLLKNILLRITYFT